MAKQRKHRHQWHPLYRKPPKGSELETAYAGDTLGKVYECLVCHKVGREFPKGVEVMRESWARAHRDRAERWNAEVPQTIH